MRLKRRRLGRGFSSPSVSQPRDRENCLSPNCGYEQKDFSHRLQKEKTAVDYGLGHTNKFQSTRKHDVGHHWQSWLEQRT